MIWKLLAAIFCGPAFWLFMVILQAVTVGALGVICIAEYRADRSLVWSGWNSSGFMLIRGVVWFCVCIVAYLAACHWWRTAGAEHAKANSGGAQ